MNMPPAPRIGQWYKHLDTGEAFLVTAYDERSGTADIQSFDGDLDELDSEAWAMSCIEPIDPPEDESGPLDSAPQAEDLTIDGTVVRDLALKAEQIIGERS